MKTNPGRATGTAQYTARIITLVTPAQRQALTDLARVKRVSEGSLVREALDYVLNQPKPIEDLGQ